MVHTPSEQSRRRFVEGGAASRFRVLFQSSRMCNVYVCGIRRLLYASADLRSHGVRGRLMNGVFSIIQASLLSLVLFLWSFYVSEGPLLPVVECLHTDELL